MKITSLFVIFWTLSASLSAQTHTHDHGRHGVMKVVETLEKGVKAGEDCPTPIPTNLDQESQLLADKKWYAGSKDCSAPKAKSPPYEVHQVNEGYFILRQNKCVNFEAPFIYLYLGAESAFLLDTGASYSSQELPLREWVDEVLKKHPKGDKLKLIVAHSHSHGDHVAGDEQFTDRPNTTVIGTSPQEVARAFNIKNWPNEIGSIDLGGRKLSILPIPGHEASSIAVYDHKSRDLLTGDSLYPGNIFLGRHDWKEYQESVKRMHDFSKKNPVRNILGAHIEMSTQAKSDYPYGSTYHPDEHRLPLYQKDLDELNNFVQNEKSAKGKKFNDFIIPID